MRAVIVALVLAALWGNARADTTSAMSITFDVAEGREPEHVCVIAYYDCRARNNCQADTLSTLLDAALDELPGANHVYQFKSKHLDKLRSADVKEAMKVLVDRSPTDRCDAEDNTRCTADVRLEQFTHQPSVSATQPLETPIAGRIICGGQAGARAEPEAGRLHRVVLIGLSLGGQAISVAGISEVKLYGTTATVRFEAPVDAAMSASGQVIGGDYAFAQVPLETAQHLRVRLQPRCSPVAVHLPSHVTNIVNVSALGARCTGPIDPAAWGQSARTLTVEVPHGATAAPQIKIGFVSRGHPPVPVDAQPDDMTNEAEARWFGDTPPPTAEAELRQLEFTWKRMRDCLSDRWPNYVDPAQRPVAWTASCPKATVAGVVGCEVSEVEDQQDAAFECRYTCKVHTATDAVKLPAEVKFERVRLTNRAVPTAKDRQPSEVVYAWTDRLEIVGQSLRSTVAPQDRRLIVELDPAQWARESGNQIDALRIIVGGSSNEIQLAGEDDRSTLSPWYSIATPGRTCADRARIAVFGTRLFDERTIPLKTGELALDPPIKYRSVLHGYFALGTGVSYREFPTAGTPLGSIGYGGQLDLAWPPIGGPSHWSFNFEGALALTRYFYRGIELPGAPSSPYHTVPYLRVDMRVGIESWSLRRLGWGVMTGIGLGAPAFYHDDPGVSSVKLSWTNEAHLIFTLSPHRVWLMVGLGLRLLERQIDYTTDFFGQPPNDYRRSAEPSILATLRWMFR